MDLRRTGLAACLASVIPACVAAAPARLPANIAAAAADGGRTAQAAADPHRHGPQILAFAGVRPGAKVLDLIPGEGYWTQLFSKAVGPRGRVYGVWPNEYLKVDGESVAAYRKLAQSPEYGNVSVLDEPAAALSVPARVDLVFTSQNYHDYPDKFMGPVDPSVLNRAVFAALKPGGTYLVIDHVADAGSGHRDTDTLHRIDPASVKAEVTAAGFRFIGSSPLLANAADNHKKKVFDPAIRGDTDQFIYKFRKP